MHRLKEAQHGRLHRVIHRRRHHALRRLHVFRCAFTIDLYGEFSGQWEIEVQIQREQRALRACLGFHAERNGHGHGQVVMLVVQIELVAKITSLAALANDHDAGVVEIRRA